MYLKQAAINKLAQEIEAAAKICIEKQIELKQKIYDLRNNRDELFALCIEHVSLPEGHLVISYILNNTSLFPTLEQRAEFGMQQDTEGNTLMHHAAKLNKPKVLQVLNHQKDAEKNAKYPSSNNPGNKRILFTPHNKAGETAFALACRLGNVQACEVLAGRIFKTTHNLNEISLAFQNQHADIVALFIDWILQLKEKDKMTIQQKYAHLLISAAHQEFGETIKMLVDKLDTSPYPVKKLKMSPDGK